MTPGQSKLPSDSIKVVPGRSKLRVESSNPVARGNPVPRSSKVKLITPEEAIKLHSGVSQVPVPPPSESSRPYKPARPTFESRLKPVRETFESQRREPARSTFESSRPKHVPVAFESQRHEPARATFESSRPKHVPATFDSQRREPSRAAFESQRPKHVPATFDSQRREPSRAAFESQRPKHVPATFDSQRREPSRAAFESQRPKHLPATFESQRREPSRATFESQRREPSRATFESQRREPSRATFEEPRQFSAVPTSKPPRPAPPRPNSKPPRPVPVRPAEGFRKEIVCGLPAASSMNTATVKWRTNTRILHQPKTVELPPSPSALQIPSNVQQQATTDATTHTIQVVEVADKAKDNGSKETCGSTSDERISELLLYRPALLPTWKGRIVDSAMLFPEFDCQFCANPASCISKKALRLSKAMPIFLEVELDPTGHILNALFGRTPRLSDVELYFFSHEKETERSKREHAHLFEAMVTRNAMIKASVNGTQLLIFSSKLLDKTSQFFIKKQKKTENYLWGFFLGNKNSQSHVPRTDKNLDDANVVDMDIDTEDQTPWLNLQPIAESQRPSCSYR
ncbi:unnamed protein product [Eruca vesicaria subsp. sativa]|uniref:AIPP2-like SPOC-like domain-containing protein n=1 Tax=Eruca vesicaria subsp. sativa TaxID=29727 RepID=A0ABC8KT90_ERUVS|nr:unnamed protein product [Eruca vesicaria subsp. sativa]